jgi:hypothetical protein
MVSVARRLPVLATYVCLMFESFHCSRILFITRVLSLFFTVWILGRCVVGVFPRLGTSGGDGQRTSATVAECASVRPLSLGHSVPLPSATALGFGIHRLPRSTCKPIIGSWREPTRILQVAHRPICSLPSHSALMLGPRWKSCYVCASRQTSLAHVYVYVSPNASRCRFSCRSIDSDPKTNNCDRILQETSCIDSRCRMYIADHMH